jgi:hypothetical protein
MQLADRERLWYAVGCKMAHAIDSVEGREALLLLIDKPSICFIDRYLSLISKHCK